MASYFQRLRIWIENNYKSTWGNLNEDEFQKIVKFDVYTGFQCVYQDINEIERDICHIARAADEWKHIDDGERFDFVVINKSDINEEGIDGIEIGRLLLITSARWTLEEEDYVYKLAVVRMLGRIPSKDIFLPVFEYTENVEVVNLDRIVRTAHMIPHWPTEKAEIAGNQYDVYDKYEQMVWNIHTDNACWNYYY